ncbi:M23 family metallopeptidase [Pseudarthrobacter sp. Y6]|uniref:M23 family metallopeptidase n=1 Tax=Pseudarthrobacter sp. Y6 TaxID=3418422 RepID=UPI003CF351A3
MIRPVDIAPSQLYGQNPTSVLYPGHPDYWIIEQFGNYQPDGHTGEDYPCKSGTPVRAVTSGTVLHVGKLSGSYADNPWWISPGFAGYCYVVDHGSFIGIYGHCMDGGARVTKGQRVAEGQVLGLSGNTGASTGDHLHFEVLPDGYVLNSYMYGRINPANLFGLASQSAEITPIPSSEDDDMAWSFEDKLFLQNELERRRLASIAETKTALAEAVFDLKVFFQADNENRHVATRDTLDQKLAEVQAELVAKLGELDTEEVAK